MPYFDFPPGKSPFSNFPIELSSVAVAQLPNRWVIATMGVTTAVVSTNASIPNWAGRPTNEITTAAMGATEAAGPTAAIPINSKLFQRHAVNEIDEIISKGWTP